MRSEATVPTPSSLSRVTWPPISSASRREIDRPSPVPPKRRPELRSLCTKGANRRWMSSLGMPMPVSSTLTTTTADSLSIDSTRACSLTLP
ncbi:hypothetical protein D3C76_900020 [compost metagenome]